MDWRKYKRHKESAKYPDITGAQWERFLNGIAAETIRLNPIVLRDGEVFDGWQRYRACIIKDIEPPFIVSPSDTDEEEEVDWRNNRRRHESQEIIEARANDRVHRVVSAKLDGQSTRAIAEHEGISQTQVMNDLAKATEQGCSVDPPNNEVKGKDGKKRKAGKPKPCCTSCETKKRENQDVPKKCPECAALRKAAKGVKVPKEKPAPAPVVTDEADHKLPEACKPSFETLAKYKEMDSHCRELQALIDEVARGPGGEQLARVVQATKSGDKVAYRCENLNALKRDIKGVRPHSVCPWCKGSKAKECKGCSGHGWITKLTWDNAEDKVKERLA